MLINLTEIIDTETFQNTLKSVFEEESCIILLKMERKKRSKKINHYERLDLSKLEVYPIKEPIEIPENFVLYFWTT
ncbi:hypothetical protein [Paenibacillus sp. GCM10027629]|uniref:hypothetical protein n=1 Tax=Paenibacillus sp. GCM10027629 TaxID=3273414 RepID=UPI0036D258D8